MSNRGVVFLVLIFTVFLLIINSGYTQTINSYNFGTYTASFTTAGTTNALSSPPSGNAFVYIASGVNGGVHLKNPGLSTFGSGSKLMLHSSSSAGTSNKFAIYGHSGGPSSYVKFTLAISDSTGGSGISDGALYFCTGNGGSFTNNSSLSPGDIVTGLRWNISGTGTISTDAIKSGNSWRSIDINPFYQGQANVYTVEVFGNNSSTTVNYIYNGTPQTVATLKQDIYVNGLLCANDADVSSNGLPVNTNINSFMFFAESNKANNLCAFVDDITYSTGIATSYVTYTEYYAKPTGNLELISSWTTNSDGSGTQYAPDFAGDLINGAGKVAMNFNLKNRSTATIGGNWAITGQYCRLILGDSTNSVTLTIPSAMTFSSSAVEINNSSILKNQSATSTSFGTFIIRNGGIYQHDCNGGMIPTGTWNSGSLCNVTGITNSAPGGLDQSFYNFTWNCPTQSANVNLGGPAWFTVLGDFGINSTGGVTGRTLQLTNTNSRSVSLTGNLNLNGGHLALTSGSGTDELSVLGNVTLSNSSELYLSQGGSANGSLILNGNLTVNSNSMITETGSSTGNIISFNNNGSQSFSNSGSINNDINFLVNSNSNLTLNNTIPVSTGRNFTVNGTLICGMNTLSGSGNFILSNGATLNIGSPSGITSSALSGNVQVTGSRNYSSTANYIYKGSAGNSPLPQVTGDGLPSSVNNLTIDNSSGITLSGSTTVSNSLTFISGILNIGNYDLTIGSTGIIYGESSSNYVCTNGSGSLKMFIENSGKIFPVGNGSYTPLTAINFGTSDIYSVKVKNSFDNVPLNYKVVNKQWSISENVAGGSNLNITLQWNQGDENPLFYRNSIIYMGQYNGFYWEGKFASNGVTGTGPYSVTSSGFTGMYPFILGNDESMPVELTNFSAVNQGKDINLAWSTSTEINNSGFDVERKTQGTNEKWDKIGFIKGKNNQNQNSDYIYNDKNLEPGKYTYRLKQIDNNGNYKYYELNRIIEVSTPKKYYLSQNYPNPFNPVTKFNFELPQQGTVTAKIYDVSGREISVLADGLYKAGYHELIFNGINLSSGVYYCKFNIKSEGIEKSFIKKMMLIK